MKKLTLILTSLLLAGAANAGIAEFTTDNTQAEGWQDFEVAHGCGPGKVHTPNWRGHSDGWFGGFGRGGKDGRGHNSADGAKCEHKWKIEKCRRANRVINLWADSNNKNQSVDQVCGVECPIGEKTGKGDNSLSCVPDNCPKDTVWQSVHLACVHVVELRRYCKNDFNWGFNEKTRECEPCPNGYFAQESGCLSYQELNDYCIREHSTYFSPHTNSCLGR